jgi:hypothetical protein
MDTVLRFGQASLVGSAMLILAACGGGSTPTAAGPVAETKTTTFTAAEPTSSVLVSGVVVDSSNRPVAGAEVECVGGNVSCTGSRTDVSAEDGPDFGVKTHADGSYQLVVVASGGSEGGFLLNASAGGYQVEWQRLSVPDAACTSDQARCAITQNFTLTEQPE